MIKNLKILMLSATGVIAIVLAVVSGCTDTTTNTPITTYIDNPNVKSFDSIGVAEDSAAFVTRTGLNLLDGVNTIDTAQLRDCSLNDLNNAGIDFFLQNGQLINNVQFAGYEIRFFQVDANMTVQNFDSLQKITTTGHDTLSSLDFTQDGTSNWGYFNAPLSSTPVYCFWLKGKKDAGITAQNVYGIIQPKEATDRDPSSVYGYRMSFRVRINTNGENDFRKRILHTQ